MKRLALPFFLLSTGAGAQCVMCFRTAAAQNTARAHLLNAGIVLLGFPPFCILAGFLYLAWRRNKTFDVREITEQQPGEPLPISTGTR